MERAGWRRVGPHDRDLLKRATDLLLAADTSATATHDPEGWRAAFELRILECILRRATMPFIRSHAVGIDARLRIVDAAQYRRRLQQFD